MISFQRFVIDSESEKVKLAKNSIFLENLSQNQNNEKIGHFKLFCLCVNRHLLYNILDNLQLSQNGLVFNQ